MRQIKLELEHVYSEKLVHMRRTFFIGDHANMFKHMEEKIIIGDSTCNAVINFQKLDQIEANLEKKEEKSFKLDSKRSLKMTSIPKNSQDAKTLADMVQSSKSSSIIAGVQVVNGLMLSQFELQASQGNILFIERLI
jgi:protein O-GlcNAc transferase